MNKIYLVFVLLLGFNLSVFGQFPGTPYFTNSTAVLQPPTIGTGTAGAGQATITYTEPASNGGAAITSYTATSSPGGLTGTVSQAGSGVITVSGLTNGTAYTFTVRATNAAGTGPASAPSNSVTPLSNVTIGTGVWTNKNLDVTTYSDGTVIPQVTDPTAWATLTTGAWCYVNNTATNGTTYGKLYNWYAVAGIFDAASLSNTALRKRLAPTGWHIPTDAEWTTLTNFLGGESVAGGKMKSTGTTVWTSPNTGATNSSGFSALQGGYRASNGSFVGFVGYWWSSSEFNATNVWSRYLSYNTVIATRISDNKAAAFSVRCLRSGAPALTTTPITAITPTAASAGGSLILDGGDTVTARGVCWSTNPAPTVALTTKTTDGTGTADFTSAITGLALNTTYYVRAYATNSVGTSYGDQLSFTTSVSIGTQIWQSTNLDVTTYRDGTVIPQVTDPTAWAGLTTGAWCYNNNDASNGTTYGKLYNWYAVAGIFDAASLSNTALRKQLAPAGCHVASDAEWTALTTFLGGESVAGGKMKSTGTTFWTSPNTGATNSSGFSALQGGYRDSNGTFSTINGNWWSFSEFNTTNAWSRYLNYNFVNAYRINYNKAAGFSVRWLVNGAPALITTPISAITPTTASAGGSLILDGGDTVTARGICWSTSRAPTIALTTKTTDGTGTVDFTSAITGLAINTTYYVRAYATNSFGTGYGAQVSFTTPTFVTPTLTTTAITAITPTTASSGGSISNDGFASVIARGVCWSTSPAPTVALPTKTTDGTGTADFTSAISGLTPNTAYYVRSYATNSVGTAYGAQVSFTTPTGTPTVTTTWPWYTNAQDRRVIAGGNVTSIGYAPITARGICWGTSPHPTVDLTTKTNDMMVPNNASYNSDMTGLPINTNIYYRAYATNSFGTSYGLESSFWLVIPTVPDVTTYTPSDVRSTSVFVSGSVGSNTSSDTVRGVCWSTSTGPTVALTTKKVAGTTGTGGFSILITTLAVNTTYFIRAFATNNVGTGYGEEYSFTTTGPADAPTIGIATIGVAQATITYTAPVFNGGYIIRSYTATSSPGGLTGTVYQTGSGSITVSGLNHGTAYTFTVKANNYYGASAASAASNAVVPISPSVVIETQIWQSDNLAVSTYSDGTIIPQVTNKSAWERLTTGAWCYYDNSLGNASFGKLYNWYAVAGIHDNDPSTPNKKLAPAGWHVPLDSEWDSIRFFYARKLKSTTYWRACVDSLFVTCEPELYPLTDLYGFTAEPFGGRFGVFSQYAYESYWWTGSDGGLSSATGISMYYNSASVSIDRYSDKNWGHYVRCVKD